MTATCLRLDGCERVEIVSYYTSTLGDRIALVEVDYHDGFGPMQIGVTTDRLVVTA